MKQSIGFWKILGILFGLGVAVVPVSVSAQKRPFEGETLRVQFWSGSEGETIQLSVVEPFTKETGARVIIEHGGTPVAIAKLRAQKADPQLDIAYMDDVGVVTLAREKLLDPLDLSKISEAANIDPRFIVEGAGLGAFLYIDSLVYNPQLVKTPPTSWSVLWDPAYKRRVAISPIGLTPAFKLAVMAAILNGGSQYNMEPAWQALRKLKPNVHSLQQNPAVLAELMKAGEVAFAIRPIYYFKPYIEKGYPIVVAAEPKEGIFAGLSCATIVKGHKAKTELVYAFLNRVASVEAQERAAAHLWFGPTNRRVRVPNEVERFALTPDKWDRVVKVDLENFTRNRDVWINEYNKIFAE